MKRVLVLGGGLAGLSCAYFLKKRTSLRVTLLEKQDRVGGVIQSVKKGEFLFERGPRGFRGNTCTLDLCRELNLEPIQAHDNSKTRYLLNKGKLVKVTPSKVVLRHFFSFLKERKIPPMTQSDETIETFFTRRFGKKFTLELIDPLIKGIHGGNISELSVRSCFPKLYHMEKEGSLFAAFLKKKASFPLYTFKEGMETFCDALRSTLNDEIELESTIQSIEKRDSSWVVTTQKGEYTADYLISTLPSPVLAKLISLPFTLPYIDITTINLGWRGSLLKKRGYGYLSPSSEKEKILGVTFDSSLFPEKHPNKTVLCVMVKGECDKEVALDCVKRHLGIAVSPDTIDLFTSKMAIPQYPVGHHQYQKQNEETLFFAGPLFDGAGVNEAIMSADKTVHALLEKEKK